ncbi:MAG TPA: TetR/AcrR family transcriptional regulator [Micromonosporaceae bacterium]|nr:TetR/AcrR family transcriptional regulator [Micromonosporaceae bacterium]
MNTARRNARGEASLRRILDATLQLVSQYGYDDTTIARITKATQLPASSIYWYFENKDDLIAAALESFYTRFIRTRRSWEGFDRSRSLLGQLLDELEPELRASESEEPLRLGIMLALEGDAAQPKIQEPFQRRRAGALARIEAWWDAAFAAFGAAGDGRSFGTWWMATLTLAYLDGHYISDGLVDHRAAAHRSRIVAYSLAGAFEALRRSEEVAAPRKTDIDASREIPASREAPDDHSTGPAALLRVTRSLVAERGYDGATIRRICAAAGIQRSSAYWRYKDKDALVKAAVSEPFLALFAPLRALPESAKDWPANLADALRAAVRSAHAQPETVKAGLLLRIRRWDEPTSSGGAVLDGIATTEASLAAWFDRVLPAGNGAEPMGEHLAWTVVRLTEGLMLVSALGRPVPAESVGGIVAAMFASVLDHWPAGV